MARARKLLGVFKEEERGQCGSRRGCWGRAEERGLERKEVGSRYREP